MLAAVLADLDEAVLVVGMDGRVTLANALAQLWLAGGSGLLGRSLYTFFDRGVLAPSFGRLQEEEAPAERVALVAYDGMRLEARVTLFRRADGGRAGFVLALRETPDAPEEAASPPPDWTRFVGAGTTAGTGGEHRPLRGPDLYDFSFFDPGRLALTPSAGCRARSGDVRRPRRGDDRAGARPRRPASSRSPASRCRARSSDARSLRRPRQPGRPIPPASVALHGISDARVAGLPALDAVLPAFLRYAEGAVLVGHEVWFDLRFLDQEATRLGLPSIASSRTVLDTRLLSRFVHGELPEHDLDAMAARLGVTTEGRHSALGDAFVTAEVLVRLLGLLRGRGISTLGALLDLVDTLRRPSGRA